MATFFNRNCPHCGHKTIFRAHGYYSTEAGQTFVLGRCMSCGRPVVAGFLGNVPVGGFEGNIEARGYTLLVSWPESIEIASPMHTPDRPANLYVQGLDNQKRGNWDAAGMAFRTCLDQALRFLHPDGKGTLARRIDDLPLELGVTPSMKQWAHEIRTLGNEAAHEDQPFDEASTKDLQSFTEVFLMYAFTLPGMLKTRHPTE